MSMSKYFKNRILCGDADYHCLLCQETFKSITDVEKHIRWEKHRKSIKNQTSLPKFKKDAIFKIENNYYCEFCNYTTRDIEAVVNHINDEKHKINKNRPEGVVRKALVQYDSGLLVLDNIIINENQWHCTINSKCLLCNTNIQDLAKHVISQDHVIKLIQAQLQSIDGQYYRKINKDIFQCFTCSRYFSTELFTDHWSSKNHMDNICVPEQKQSCADSKSKVKCTTEDARPKSRDIINSNILEMLAEEARKMIIETQKQFFDFNTDDKTATCKVCKKVVKFDLNDILEHMKTHANVKVTEDFGLDRQHKNDESDDEVEFAEVQDHGKRRSELSKFGKENFIKLNPGGSKGLCILCDKHFSASLKVFKQHMKGVCHLGHLEMKGLIQSTTQHDQFDYVLFPLNTYIKSMTHAREMKVMWINREFTVDCYSLMLLKKIEFGVHYKVFKCYACDEIVREGNELSHCKTIQHKTKFMDIKIFAYDTEFIREVQPNLYHCGFCNQIFPFAEILQKHLEKPKHGIRKKKMEGNSKLIICNYEKFPSTNNYEILYLQLLKATFGKC